MIDFHTHTGISYCAEKDLNASYYATRLRELQEPKTVCITDHSMAIYFPEDIAWKWEFISNRKIFDQWKEFGNERFYEHLKNLKKHSADGILAGIETEMLHDRSLCFDQSFRKDLDIVIGSVHFLPVENERDCLAYWFKHTIELINAGIDILGHPFRWIAAKMQISEETILAIVSDAKKNNVALELNSHYRYEREDILMLRACAQTGTVVSIASDSHRKNEFGDYSYHFSVLEKSGVKNYISFKKTNSKL